MMVFSVLGISGIAQLTAQELGACRISAHPVPAQKEVVNLVWEDQFLEVDLVPAQGAHEFFGLGKGNVAIIVAVNQ